ncbi:MAG: hypothetical protein ABII79_06630 [bacterium]
MITALLILVVVVAAVCLLNLRIRFELSEDRRLLFVGLGRTGPELDFAVSRGVFRLAGIRVKTFTIGERKPSKPKKKPEKPHREKPPKKATRSLRDILRVGSKCLQPLGSFLIGILKSVAVERLEGQIEGGFESPDLTGRVFGYYQAALAVAPGVVGRVRFIPDWTGASFGGTARVAVALPLYKLLARTAVLIYRLPLRELIRLAIGKKKGEQDVQQRR